VPALPILLLRIYKYPSTPTDALCVEIWNAGRSGPSEFGNCSGDGEDLVGEGLQHGDDVGVKVLHRRFGLI
jgi:hypothetical protein